jgi:tripartite-type tricarboxylate transporter receptor subunit TctC
MDKKKNEREKTMILLRALLRTWHLAGALLLAMPQAASAQAPQPWPERTIQAIVPFAAGAANDIVGRIVLEQVSKQVNQPIVVENRPGAGGTIGVTAVGKAQPNGHTLLVHPRRSAPPIRSTRACPTTRSMISPPWSRSGRRRQSW